MTTEIQTDPRACSHGHATPADARPAASQATLPAILNGRLRAMLARLALLAAVILTMAAPTHASAACTGGKYLKGWYGVLAQGPSLTTGYGRYFSGAVYFDGACNLWSFNTYGGVDESFAHAGASGTYGGATSASIALVLNVRGQATQTYTIGVAANDKEAYGVETDSIAVATITLTPQNFTGAYANSTLSGIYTTTCSGNNAGFTDLNVDIFDGVSALTGVDTYNNQGDKGTINFGGSYQVASDGTFNAPLTGYFQGYTINGVIVQATQWIYYNYSTSSTGGVVACVGKH